MPTRTDHTVGTGGTFTFNIHIQHSHSPPLFKTTAGAFLATHGGALTVKKFFLAKVFDGLGPLDFTVTLLKPSGSDKLATWFSVEKSCRVQKTPRGFTRRQLQGNDRLFVKAMISGLSSVHGLISRFLLEKCVRVDLSSVNGPIDSCNHSKCSPSSS